MRLSSGVIQRLSSAAGEACWRPKSSITSTPPLAVICTGAE